MSNDDAGATRPYGPALVRWLDRETRARGYTSLGDWATANEGVTPTSVTRWRQGQTPRPDMLRVVADLMGVGMVDILLAAEILLPSDIKGRKPPTTPVVTPQDAIRASTRISEPDKAHLIAMVDRFEITNGPTKVETRPPRK